MHLAEMKSFLINKHRVAIILPTTVWFLPDYWMCVLLLPTGLWKCLRW